MLEQEENTSKRQKTGSAMLMCQSRGSTYNYWLTNLLQWVQEESKETQRCTSRTRNHEDWWWQYLNIMPMLQDVEPKCISILQSPDIWLANTNASNSSTEKMNKPQVWWEFQAKLWRTCT